MQNLINRAENASYLSALRDHLAPLSAPLPHPEHAQNHAQTYDAVSARMVWGALALFWLGVISGLVMSW